MYILLKILTLTIFGLVIIPLLPTIFTYDNNRKIKTNIKTLLLLISIIALFVIFCITSPSIKNTPSKWHTIYTNNINADIKIESENITLNPKKPISKKDIDQLFEKSFFLKTIDIESDSIDVAITATNEIDSTTKTATLDKENIIEKWPKGKKPNRTQGTITKIEYRTTPITNKLFGRTINKIIYPEVRITIEYKSVNNKSTKTLFGEK